MPETEAELTVAEKAVATLNEIAPHPLVAGIRMFTAMLDEAKTGYIVDRLSHLQERLDIQLTEEEHKDVFEIALCFTDEDDIPNVAYAVDAVLTARTAAGLGGDKENLTEEPPDPL